MVICATLFFSNLRLSKQFTGGIEFKLEGTQTASQVEQKIINDLADTNLRVTANESNGLVNVLIQQNEQNEEKLTEHSKKLQANYASNIKEFAIVWPSIGDQISNTAKWAIIRGLILMALFIVFEFSRIRKVIQPWILAVITIFTMLFDLLSPMWVYGIVMRLNPTMQVDVIFVIALLTTMGYSISDTVVIFDRIREHIENDKKNIAEIFENSLWETMARSLMTSGLVLVTVVSMYIFGTGDLKHFAYVMIFGVISGSASSIFLASPLAYLIIKYSQKK